MKNISFFLRPFVLPLVLLTAGCGAGIGSTLGTLGTLGSIAELLASPRQAQPPPQQVELTAEVRQVDARRQLIQVETADGRAGGVMYDLATTVVHEQQPYPITSLQPGDVVELLLERAAHNNLYARRIAVVRLAREDSLRADTVRVDSVRVDSVRVDTVRVDTVRVGPVVADPAPRPDTLPAVRQLVGEVGRVEVDDRRFRLHAGQADSVEVTLPPAPPAEMLERFLRLSRGDTVRVEVRPLGSQRGELRRFVEPVPDQPPPRP